MTWEGTDEAATYNVMIWIEDPPGFTLQSTFTGITGLDYTLPGGTLANSTTYMVSVEGYNSNGTIVSYSPGWVVFTTI